VQVTIDDLHVELDLCRIENWPGLATARENFSLAIATPVLMSVFAIKGANSSFEQPKCCVDVCGKLSHRLADSLARRQRNEEIRLNGEDRGTDLGRDNLRIQVIFLRTGFARKDRAFEYKGPISTVMDAPVLECSLARALGN
jgi:hypothetical protein